VNWLIAKAPPGCRRFDYPANPEIQIIRSASSPNDNGPSPNDEGPLERLCPVLLGVADGTRTHDDQNHNLGLYQLSYSHRREGEV
jgi:hypothetical protein